MISLRKESLYLQSYKYLNHLRFEIENQLMVLRLDSESLLISVHPQMFFFQPGFEMMGINANHNLILK